MHESGGIGEPGPLGIDVNGVEAPYFMYAFAISIRASLTASDP